MSRPSPNAAVLVRHALPELERPAAAAFLTAMADGGVDGFAAAAGSGPFLPLHPDLAPPIAELFAALLVADTAWVFVLDQDDVVSTSQAMALSCRSTSPLPDTGFAKNHRGRERFAKVGDVAHLLSPPSPNGRGSVPARRRGIRLPRAAVEPARRFMLALLDSRGRGLAMVTPSGHRLILGPALTTAACDLMSILSRPGVARLLRLDRAAACRSKPAAAVAKRTVDATDLWTDRR